MRHGFERGVGDLGAFERGDVSTGQGLLVLDMSWRTYLELWDVIRLSISRLRRKASRHGHQWLFQNPEKQRMKQWSGCWPFQALSRKHDKIRREG